jgi:hypothetical protein
MQLVYEDQIFIDIKISVVAEDETDKTCIKNDLMLGK